MTDEAVVEVLKIVLADNYALYLKTQNYHWNVEGSNFRELHLLFEEQYIDLAKAIDTVAELIRGLGKKAPATFEAYIKNTSIKSGDENISAQQMIEELAADQTVIQKTLQQALEIAQKAGDEVVADFMIERLTFHRKAAWMLNSSI
ncbi:DNA starvation/stationary phase protection protein (plasmid) [Candidatus Trichorickettsia mobilis]|jgi:starvation-inducible DNA-binding protein|uniref:Dps family protein n=1 Tax=Candidatus Trichorickettsia mobilis TaxID=1346319 RepID=UPI002B25837C|nr:DNA starvation/stationary phase protection protein [Candidatus Trichorickettsia mobilis]WPY01640.1 DNA starvation/stationary phase protection protein [Candidatus Trichorickettsia mobilis]